MSRTLFAYIFKDLIRIFLMASGALAGIMSFGGLLRPLTREGLDAGQVARMLAYFGPAMTTYSFPVAALFATAVVYGRLSADNELTACKAGGISLLSLTVSGPALVLGLIVAIASLLFLCFIVPASTLRVEKVIYSNLAKLVQSRIERTHEINFEQTTIFAQDARVIPPDPKNPTQQRVELIGPEIISVERDPEEKLEHASKPGEHSSNPAERTLPLLVPKEFYTASRAFVYIDPLPDGEQVNVTVILRGGFKFPRRYAGASEAGIGVTQYGPFQIPSPIKEDVKFMNVFRLKELYNDLSESRKLRVIIADFVKNGQRNSFLGDVANAMNSAPQHEARFNFGKDGSYSLGIDDGKSTAYLAGDIYAPPPVPRAATQAAPSTMPVARPIVFREEKPGREPHVLHAASVLVRAQPLSDFETAHVTITLKDCVQMMKAPDGTDIPEARAKFDQSFNYPLSDVARAMAGRSIAFYESKEAKGLGDQSRLTHDKTALINAIIAESNGRASFAISCLILVMVGSALGMMFRSGNFLTAFAVSFVPAMLSITLIIAGQRTAANVPMKFTGANNPLQLGLVLIWTGNAVNLVLAVGLLWKLGQTMKILDRYVIISFIKNYCISFMVLVGMYVVLDMVFNFSNLVQFQPQASAVETLIGTLRDMGDYYFYQCFLFFVHLSGIIPVVAAAFTLMRLSRFNELTAMLAAGVPLLRIAMPIVLVALVLNVLLLVDQEVLIPNMIPKLVRDHDEIHKEAKNFFTIAFMQDAEDGLLHVSRYYPHGLPGSTDHIPMMEKLDVLVRKAVRHKVDNSELIDLQPVSHILADRAFWNPATQGWDLEKGKLVEGLNSDETRSAELPYATYKSSNITPEEINLYRSGNYVDLLSTARINELLDRPKSFGTLNLLRVKHWRFTQPLMNVILLLLAIPCVLTREPGRLKSGATKCLFFMGVGMGSTFLSQQLAANPISSMAPDRWAALMAWLPIFIFGPLSVFLLERIKT